LENNQVGKVTLVLYSYLKYLSLSWFCSR